MPRVSFGLLDFSDRRGRGQLGAARALEQERLDQALEAEWRRRVAANERRRMTVKVDRMLGAVR